MQYFMYNNNDSMSVGMIRKRYALPFEWVNVIENALS